MIKKTIEWEDLFEEVTRTQDFYFHLTKDDIVTMELGGNLTEAFRKLAETEDDEAKWAYIKNLIQKSYGTRDGDSFDKTDEKAAERFMHSPAFDSLMIELLTNEKAMIEFIIGIFPRDLARQISQADIDRAMAQAKAQAGIEDVGLPADPEDKPALEELGELTEEERLDIIRRRIHEE